LLGAKVVVRWFTSKAATTVDAGRACLGVRLLSSCSGRMQLWTPGLAQTPRATAAACWAAASSSARVACCGAVLSIQGGNAAEARDVLLFDCVLFRCVQQAPSNMVLPAMASKDCIHVLHVVCCGASMLYQLLMCATCVFLHIGSGAFLVSRRLHGSSTAWWCGSRCACMHAQHEHF
ncbi:hypothetical protein COO60DRAFT_1530180, partial [Scenedesmus sp. NREL 46B-D3]